MVATGWIGRHRRGGRRQPPPACVRPGRRPHALLEGGSGRLQRQRGFLLPLAFGTSLLLLLGSLSLQTLVLQARIGLRRQEQRGQQEDALASASQQLVAALNREHPCLLALPLQRWGSDGLVCASPSQQRALAGGGPPEARWQLIDWQPGAGQAAMLLALDPAAGRPGRRARYGVELLASPLRAGPAGLLAFAGVAP